MFLYGQSDEQSGLVQDIKVDPCKTSEMMGQIIGYVGRETDAALYVHFRRVHYMCILGGFIICAF